MVDGSPATGLPAAHGRAGPGRWDGAAHRSWVGTNRDRVRQRFVRAPTNARRPPRTAEHVHAAHTVCARHPRWSGAPRDSFRFNV